MDVFDRHNGQNGQAEIIKLPLSQRSSNVADFVPPEAKSGGAMTLIEAYWHALRGDRDVPMRSEVDPRGIESALKNAFVAERIAPGHARIRIAGTHLGDLMGMEVRGMPLSAMFETEARVKLQAALRAVFDEPAIYKFDLRAPGRIGKPELKASMSIYPLRNDMGDISRALGCFVAEGKIGRAPRRFDILHTNRIRLQMHEGPSLAAPEVNNGADAPIQPQPLAGFAETQANFETTSVPYLKLVT